MPSITRRGLIQGAALVSADILARRRALPQQATPTPLTLDPTTLARYVDPLPIPEIARPNGYRPDPEDPASKLPYYRIAMRAAESQLHRDLPPTRVWGFGKSSPGPTFDTRSGEGVLVEWANELPAGKHFLPVDYTLHGAEPGVPEVRSVIHLHGGKTPASSDGYPEDWYEPGKSRTYHYPNHQPACMLFYHDHSMGINRLNIYAGMMGLYFVRDPYEDSLDLPRGAYEIPLLVYDRFLTPGGQLYYPVSGKAGAPWVPEVFGNAMLVNGKLYPYLEVEPRRYRLRLMNGSNGRFYRFSFAAEDVRSLSQRLPFLAIGTEQGFLSAPTQGDRITMAPGERTDLIFDFSAHAGEKLVLRSDSFEIMEFRVAGVARGGVKAPLAGATPQQPQSPAAAFMRLREEQAVRTRRLTLGEQLDMVQRSMGMLLNNTHWHMPVTEKPVIDTTEIWEFVNLTDDSHPIHLHLVRFQILDRRPFDTFDYQDKGVVRFTGPAQLPDPLESGWKDTVRADPGVITRIIVPFTGFTGRYVWHCHILEHEDNEMMRPYEVVSS
ncbi:MAG TPA: multicopper oxidase domain-containing protein [Acidobacteriaceae bacterium]|nr:multicopper oxidase domain-containing protein [Acidobacteriaceae bacterium]